MVKAVCCQVVAVKACCPGVTWLIVLHALTALTLTQPKTNGGSNTLCVASAVCQCGCTF